MGAEGGCFTQFANVVAPSACLGAGMGAAVAAWMSKPAVKEQTFPLIQIAARQIRNHAVLFGTIGGVFTGVSCVSKDVRGVDDWKNAAIGGGVTGFIVGMRKKKLPQAVLSGAAFAIVSAIVKINTDMRAKHKLPQIKAYLD